MTSSSSEGPKGRSEPHQRRRLSRRLRFISFFFLATGPLLSQPSAPPTEGLPTELARAADLLRDQHYGQALAAAEAYKQSSPQDPRGYYYAGLALAADGRLQEAAVELQQALQRSPDSLQAGFALASALSRLNQLQEAVQALRMIDGDNLGNQAQPEPLWLLADLYYRQEAFRDARRVLDRYAEVAPEDVRLPLRRAQIALLEGRFEEAVQHFRQALAQQPDEAAIHHGLGLALWRRSEFEPARQSLLRAVELAPDQSDFLLDLGKLLLETGAANEAIPYLERAVQTEAPPAEAFFELSRAQRRVGNLEQADLSMERFRQLRKERQSADERDEKLASALRRGQQSLRQGALRQALEAFQQAVEQDPESWLAHSYLAKIYLSSNLLSQADRHLREMQRIDPESAEGNFLLASYRYRIADHAGALEAAQKALDSRPDYGDLRNLLGNIYLALGRRQEAIQEYSAALRLEPGREDFRLNLESAQRNPPR